MSPEQSGIGSYSDVASRERGAAGEQAWPDFAAESSAEAEARAAETSKRCAPRRRSQRQTAAEVRRNAARGVEPRAALIRTLA